jgi:hypothetical protein
MKAVKARIDERLAGAGADVTIGAHRMLVRFAEDKIFNARGPWLSKSGQEAVESLGQLLGSRPRRVVIAAPMGGATVPRWIRAQLPTPADLSASRVGNVLRAVVKGGVRSETVLAVIGTLASDAPGVLPTLDFEIEL